MLKSDLKTGMVVVFRDEDIGVVMKDMEIDGKVGDYVLIHKGLGANLDDFNEDFTAKGEGFEIIDIIMVFALTGSPADLVRVMKAKISLNFFNFPKTSTTYSQPTYISIQETQNDRIRNRFSLINSVICYKKKLE